MLATRALIPAGVTLLVLWAADAALRKRRVHPAAVLLCALAGFFYAASVLPVRPSVPDWLEPGRKVGVRAVVDSVRTKPDMRLQMVLRDVTVLGAENGQDRTLPGMMAWTWKFPKNTPQPGQQVLLNVGLRPVSGFQNPGLWDYEAYWQREGVFWLGWSYGKKGVQLGPAPDGPLWRLREALKQPVLEGIGRGQGGAMVLNLLTGDRTHISPATLDMVRSAGLAHILALSGLHVGYVALMGFLLAYLVGVIRPRTYLQISRPKLAVLLAAPMVLVYWWLGQPSASLTRAALMFACWGGLLLFGRGRALLDGLFIALAVIIFHNPLAMFDTGLRMSACAVAGIALLYPVFRRVLAVRGHGAVRRVADSVAVLLCLSLSANAALLPVMAVSFGAISPNILMNVVWVPAVGFLVMPLGIAGMVLGTVPEMQVVSNLLVHGAASVADWLLLMLRHFHEAGFDPMFAVLRPLWPEALGFTLLLVTALAGRKRLCLAALGSALILLPHLYVMTVDARSGVRLAMIDVGQGQALLVAAPGG
ncbi:ComEC/Rec2 family competence protein, partial [Salidesulfovibrio brasiliensis]|uniref:ComEC/Rec2 family competence protein n=1 Tax=Salidesulfovibrio brasiliensis TaxID=221711 RepID=UPI001C43A2B6